MANNLHALHMIVKEVAQAMSVFTFQLGSFSVQSASTPHTVPQTILQESHARPSEASLGQPSE